MTQSEREKVIRDNHDQYPKFPDPDCNVCFLLTLLDKERAERQEDELERSY